MIHVFRSVGSSLKRNEWLNNYAVSESFLSWKIKLDDSRFHGRWLLMKYSGIFRIFRSVSSNGCYDYTAFTYGFRPLISFQVIFVHKMTFLGGIHIEKDTNNQMMGETYRNIRKALEIFGSNNAVWKRLMLYLLHVLNGSNDGSLDGPSCDIFVQKAHLICTCWPKQDLLSIWYYCDTCSTLYRYPTLTHLFLQCEFRGAGNTVAYLHMSICHITH